MTLTSGLHQLPFSVYNCVPLKLTFTIKASTIDVANAFSIRKLTEIKLTAPMNESKFKMPEEP